MSYQQNIVQSNGKPYPDWVVHKQTGNEVDSWRFCDAYLAEHKLSCIREKFYLDGECLREDKLERLLLDEIEPFATISAPKLRGIVDLLAMQAYREPVQPMESAIYFENCTCLLELCEDGASIDGKPYITAKTYPPQDHCLCRIPHPFDRNVEAPKRFLAFLNELFLPEDIPTIQEYLGYCLLPNTYAQKALFLIGNGGEGKSRLTYLMKEILGEACVISNVGQVSERFFGTVLENKLLFIDDDLQSNKFTDTNTFKSLVTNECEILVEPKGKEYYTICPYAKFLLMGNQSVGSLHDRTEGFYRRIHIIKVPPRPKNRKNDPALIQDIWWSEQQQILRWLVDGAVKLARQNYVLTESESSRKALQELKISDNTALEFLQESNFLYGEGYNVTSSELTRKYKDWCMDNDMFKVGGQAFKQTCEKFFEPLGGKYSTVVPSYNGKVRGYKGVTFQL